MRSDRGFRTDEGIRRYVKELTRIFMSSPDKYRAHERSRRILEDISADRDFLGAILRRHLSNPEVLNTKNYPVMRVDVEFNPYYHLVAHAWIPLPDRRTDLSTKAIHHHGQLLLTTTTVFGSGYEHWTFTKARQLDPVRELYAMKMTSRALHPLHHTAFVDAYEPHVPMYPSDLSITLALWSSFKRTTWKDRLRVIPFLQKNKEILKEIARCAGATDFLGIQGIEYFDFFPTQEGFKGMRQRIEYPLGPNEDYLHSLFHVFQRTHNDGLALLAKQHLDSGKICLANAPTLRRLLKDLKAGRPIEGRLSDCHLGLSHANYTAKDIEGALLASRAGLPTSSREGNS